MKKEEKKLANARAVARVYWRHTSKYPFLFGSALVSIFVIQIGNVIGPLFLRQLINLLTASAEASRDFNQLILPLVLYALVQLVIWIGWRVEMITGTRVAAQIMSDLTNEGFAYLMRHSYQFFSSSFSGALTRRVGRYSEAYNKLYDSITSSLLPAAIYVVGIISVLSLQNVALGAVLAVWVVIFILLQWAMSRWQQPLRIKRAEEDSAVTAALADSISNHSTVQLFSGNSYEETRIGEVVYRFRKALLRTWNFDSWVYGVQSLLSMTINLGLLLTALILWTRGLITVGDFILIQAYFIGLFDRVWGLGREFRSINTAFADAGEMVYIMELGHDICDMKHAGILAVGKGQIEFSDISFSFHNRPVLDHFALTVNGGEKIALVGPSGAGKSTITKLLLRLYDLPEGSIRIDGQNIAQVSQESLRNNIAFVPQEPILFHRTLMDNIRYGKRDATDEQVLNAAREAHCHEFISAMPQGYETYVGERGIKLSGGERQRVAIARALLKNAPILVLDEATSSLDSESESFIQDALGRLMKDKTVIVIAHRLSTIMKMDKIAVIDNGAVAACGTHRELLEQKGLYNKLWGIQAGNFVISKDDDTEEKLPEEELAEVEKEA